MNPHDFCAAGVLEKHLRPATALPAKADRAMGTAASSKTFIVVKDAQRQGKSTTAFLQEPGTVAVGSTKGTKVQWQGTGAVSELPESLICKAYMSCPSGTLFERAAGCRLLGV